VLGFVSPLACSLLGPAAGRLMDRVYRPYGLGAMVALQGAAIVASGLVVLAASTNPLVPLTESAWFGLLLVLSMLERLTAIASELAVERDWVTQLAGKDNSLALASSNARLRRLDLACELLGSLGFGWLYTTAGLAMSVAAATLLAVIFVPMQLYCVYKARPFWAGSAPRLVCLVPAGAGQTAPDARVPFRAPADRQDGARGAGQRARRYRHVVLLHLLDQAQLAHAARPAAARARGAARAAAAPGAGAAGARARRLGGLLPAAHPAVQPHLGHPLLQRGALPRRPHHRLPHLLGARRHPDGGLPRLVRM
jgi:hypothetical protein